MLTPAYQCYVFLISWKNEENAGKLWFGPWTWLITITHWNVLCLEKNGRYMSSGQLEPNLRLESFDKIIVELATFRHFDKEDNSFLREIFFMLRHTEAVGYLLEGFNYNRNHRPSSTQSHKIWAYFWKMRSKT